MPGNHRRRNLRLRGYNYAGEGAYFVTLVTQDRLCLFGDVVADDMQLNDAGFMVLQKWKDMASRFSQIDIDTFVVMPNHIHGIIVINNSMGAALSETNVSHVGAPLVGASAYVDSLETGNRATTRVAPTLGEIVGAFKSLTTVEYVRRVKTFAWPKFPGRLWQRNFYEHVIRNEESLSQVRQYILDNPAKWAIDRENPSLLMP